MNNLVKGLLAIGAVAGVAAYAVSKLKEKDIEEAEEKIEKVVDKVDKSIKIAGGSAIVAMIALYLNHKINVKNELIWNEIEAMRILSTINMVEHNYSDFEAAKDSMLHCANYITDPKYRKVMIDLINSVEEGK